MNAGCVSSLSLHAPLSLTDHHRSGDRGSSRRIDIDDTTTPSESVVAATIHHSPDTNLPESRGAHDTWLDGDI